MKLNKIARTGLITAFFLSPSLLHAAILSNESFSGYSLGELPGQNPTVTGYSGAWADAAFGDAEPSVTTGSLSYSNPLYLGSSGDKISKGADGDGINASNSGRTERLLDSSLVVTDLTAGTVYLSFLFQSGFENAAGQADVYQTLGLWNGSAENDVPRQFDAGIASGDFGTTNYAYRVNNSVVGNLGLASNATVQLFVVKFDLSSAAASDNVTVWLNPTLGAGESGGGFTTTGRDMSFDRLVFSDYASNSTNWDEVRWGTTFNAVTVPEPASALLGSLGLLALLRRRRH